jgi:hypothetical protein
MTWLKKCLIQKLKLIKLIILGWNWDFHTRKKTIKSPPKILLISMDHISHSRSFAKVTALIHENDLSLITWMEASPEAAAIPVEEVAYTSAILGFLSCLFPTLVYESEKYLTNS